MITENNEYRLYSPRGCWGTNYTIINRITDTEYLIDISDVSNTEEEEDTILYSELLELDPDSFAPYVWKIANKDSIQYRVNYYTREITELIKDMLSTENEEQRDYILQDMKSLADTRQELLNSLSI